MVSAKEWAALCESLRVAFSHGCSLRPFNWIHPGTLRRLLVVVKKLSERGWPVGTLIRAASVEIGLDSKGLERHHRTFESGLARLFGAEISLKSLGLGAGDSHVEVHGPVCLHFPEGGTHDFDGLAHVLISAADPAGWQILLKIREVNPQETLGGPAIDGWPFQ